MGQPEAQKKGHGAMPGMKKYAKEYIDECRRRIDANVRAFRKQAKKARSKEFEARYFNDQVLLLDYMFVHRVAHIEGSDGNALNEVRILCNSILRNQGTLHIGKLPQWPAVKMKLVPETSVLRLHPGAIVALSEDDFVRLAEAFFQEITKRYG
jgi:hypothetical protein